MKSYNKSGSALRVETSINNTPDFKAFRHPDDDESKPASWQKLRKGVSDLHRRAEISSQCNDRYLDAVCAAQVDETLQEVTEERRMRETCMSGLRRGPAYGLALLYW